MHTVLLAGWWSSMIWSSFDHLMIIMMMIAMCVQTVWLAGWLSEESATSQLVGCSYIFPPVRLLMFFFHISSFFSSTSRLVPCSYISIHFHLSVCLFHSKALKLVRSITLSREKLKCWFSFPLRQKDKILERNVLHEEAELAGGCFSRR